MARRKPVWRTWDRTRCRPAPGSPEAGFTLLEAVVSLAVMTVVLVGLLSLLQLNSRVAKAQVNVAEMQQSLRVAQSDIVRQVRMAGRGGLPSYRDAAGVYPGMLLPYQGLAISVQNGVGPGTTIGGNANAPVREGTDVLTLRGVFQTTFFQVNPVSDGKVPNTGNGSLVIRKIGPTGVPQDDFHALEDAIQKGRPEALLLVSTLDDGIQAVVELTGGRQVEGGTGLQLDFTTEGTHGAEYLKLSPGGAYPPQLTAVAAVGILEEYRYYVRDQPPAPRLSRARVYPGTDAPYAGDADNLHADIADNVLDLQIALGIDRNPNERIEDAQNETDDWLFNAPADTPVANPPTVWNRRESPLYYVRISTLARTDRLDADYQSPPIQAIEDHVYDEPDAPADGASKLERSYRRRLLQTVVDLRNL